MHHRICLIGLLVVAMASLPLAAYATDAPPSATNMTPAPAATASPEPTNTPTDSPSSVPQGLAGCKNDHQNVDYPLAVDCTLPATDSCPPPENVDTSVPCNSNPSDLNGNIRTYRDNSAHFKISDIVIHDTEGKGPEDGLINAALSEFQQPKNSVSIHYIVGRDGTVYQVLREKDIAYHAGNLWYNEHSIGIEHTGYEGSGFNSYTPAMYAASAKLVAYLTDKYDIPVDHAHIVSHGTIPSPYFAVGPNHLDPGPYFNFSAYFNSIDSPAPLPMKNVVTVENKKTSLQASEQPTDCNFFYLYNSPSTASEKFAIRENTESESDMSGSDAKIKSDLECAKPSTNP
ncbi:MAG: N-acetylmuramoyl-L-alanine amidase, partial [Candidatus Dormibacteraceae bacterium]